MNNLQAFLNYKNECPLCLSNLKLRFISNKNKDIIIENNECKVKFKINNFPIKTSKHYNILININIISNNFYIDFFSEFGKVLNYVPLTKLKEVSNYLNRGGSFYKFCNECDNDYAYFSEYLNFNFSNSKLDDFKIQSEGMDHYKNNDKYKIVNNYMNNKTFIISSSNNVIDIPLIHFNNEQFINKLNLILTFN